MRILFLDIDGVLNSAPFFQVLSKRQLRRTKGEFKARARDDVETWVEMIDPDTIPHLNAIVERSGAKVVISSSWRIRGWEQVTYFLQRRGFTGQVIGMTPTGREMQENAELFGEHPGTERGYEIQSWLSGWERVGNDVIDSFAILDDCDDMVHLVDRLVRTSWSEGLQARHVDAVVEILAKNKEK